MLAGLGRAIVYINNWEWMLLGEEGGVDFVSSHCVIGASKLQFSLVLVSWRQCRSLLVSFSEIRPISTGTRDELS